MLRPKYKAISASKLTVSSKVSTDCNPAPLKCSQKTSIVRSSSSLHKKSHLTSRMTKMHENNRVMEFQESRKESYLNACFHRRKNQLLKITKENKKIYQRINSQKSNYSSRNLDKSYDSVSSRSSRVSRRSNNSTGSRYSNSGVRSSNKVKIDKITRLNLPAKPILEARNINSLNSHEIISFNRMFCRDDKVKSEHMLSRNEKTKVANNQNAIQEIPQFPTGVRFTKIVKNIFTPERLSKYAQKGSSIPVSLPQLKEKTPQRLTKLETIMEDFGVRHKF